VHFLFALFTAACLAFVLVGLARMKPAGGRVPSGRHEERRRLERTDPVWGWRKPWS